jgi:hypothetical protein
MESRENKKIIDNTRLFLFEIGIENEGKLDLKKEKKKPIRPDEIRIVLGPNKTATNKNLYSRL